MLLRTLCVFSGFRGWSEATSCSAVDAQCPAARQGMEVSRSGPFLVLEISEAKISEVRIPSGLLSWIKRSSQAEEVWQQVCPGTIDPHDIPGTVVVYDLKELRLSQITRPA